MTATFLEALRPPPGAATLPDFDRGWTMDGDRKAFLAYEEAVDVNWSTELEQLHEESSRDHFIDVHTRRALLDGIAGAVGEGGTVVDVGCSSGYLLEDLRRAHPGALAVGVDLVAAGLRRAHEVVPEAPLLLADCTRLPFGDDSVDAAVSANVLEHVPDDAAALRELRRVLKPGGRVALVVPAGPALYDAYDTFLGHERRYARRELAARGREAGLEVVKDAYLGSLVYPPFWLVKKRNRRRHADLDDEGREALVKREIGRTQGSRLGGLACSLERSLLRRGVHLPFGIRSYVVLRRPA